jgi:glycogen phosphorylase
MRQQKSYRPRDYYDRDPRVKRVADAFLSRLFCPQEPDLFAWVFRSLLDEGDEYFHLADLPAYLAAQEEAAEAFRDRDRWTCMSALNVARMGKFSSDRAVAQYAHNIWNTESYELSGQLSEKCLEHSASH